MIRPLVTAAWLGLLVAAPAQAQAVGGGPAPGTAPLGAGAGRAPTPEDRETTAHDMSSMAIARGVMGDGMAGALGAYPASREAAGAAWQPDTSQPDTSAPGGFLLVFSGWSVMFHGRLNGVYDRQAGPRGGDRSFASGMFMVMTQRPMGDTGTLQLRPMLSPDPLMDPAEAVLERWSSRRSETGPRRRNLVRRGTALAPSHAYCTACAGRRRGLGAKREPAYGDGGEGRRPHLQSRGSSGPNFPAQE